MLKAVNATMPLATEREKGAHLLRRFGLGASEAELDYYLRDGLNGAIDRLLDYPSVDEGFSWSIDTFSRPQDGKIAMPAVISWWTLRLLTTRRPLQEKMTLFWHDHFATGADKVKVPMMMFDQNETLREHGTGKFRTLLGAVSKDPAMLFWLDNQYNVKGKPNENFAREVMELFTLGIGNYSEQDIQEAARAFTGWSIARQRDPEDRQRVSANFVLRRNLHDAGPKTILGHIKSFGGDDVLDLLCEMPRTAEYLTLKLWEWFAYPSPEPALLQRLARQFQQSGLDIKVLLRAIMRSSEFYSDKAERALYKNPADFAIAITRQFGVGEILTQQLKGADIPRQRLAPVAAIAQAMRGMGMQLLFPPDVAGWEHGPAWITTATMVERIGFADRVFGTVSPGKGRAAMRLPAYALFANDPTPQGVANRLVSLLDAPIPKEKMPNLVAAAQKAGGDRVTAANANVVGAAVCKLIFASPEFQFC